MDVQASALDQFAELMAGGSPHRLAERTLDVLIDLAEARSGGVFALREERLTLLASRGIDQHGLDAAEALWRRTKSELRSGVPIYVPDCAADRDLSDSPGGPGSLALFPVLDGDPLVGLLYVDSVETHFCTPRDVERLRTFSRLFARAVRPGPAPGPEPPPGAAPDLEAYLERTPVSDIERRKLLLLLNRNGWNIARVARLMGITRRTIYLRLQRYNIPRERVYKSRLRSAPAP